MIEACRKLNPTQTGEVKGLIRRCEIFDAASTCIQLDNSLNAIKDMNSWFLMHERGELVAVGSLFAPKSGEGEISLCVSENHRRARRGTSLLAAIRRELLEHEVGANLLVCDSKSASGNAFVAKQPGVSVEHSEYTLELGSRIAPPTERLSISRAVAGELNEIATICADAFGEDIEPTKRFIESSMENEHRAGFVGRLNGEIICTCFLGYEEGQVSINTVAVIKREQGKGYAKEFLLRMIHDTIDPWVKTVINVDSGNMNAYHLYKRIGFVETEMINYHLLP